MSMDIANSININNLDEVKRVHEKCINKLRALVLSGKSNTQLSQRVAELEDKIREAENIKPNPEKRVKLEKYPYSHKISSK